MKSIAINSIKFLLILLLIYAGGSKLSIVDEFQRQMYQSPLIPVALVPTLAYLIPIIEIGIAVLLMFEMTSLIGFFLSFLLMLFFSLYLIGLVAFYTKVPCACGGILGNMGYTAHIIFNIFFTLTPLWAILAITKNQSLSSAK